MVLFLYSLYPLVDRSQKRKKGIEEVKQEDKVEAMSGRGRKRGRKERLKILWQAFTQRTRIELGRKEKKARLNLARHNFDYGILYT